MTSLAGAALRERCIEEGERVGVLAQELEAPHTPVDAALAEDGVDELLTVVLPRWAPTEPLAGADATCAGTDTDTGRTWSARVDHGVVTVGRDRSGTEQAHVQAPAAVLLLRLWGRPAEVRLTGGPAAEGLLRGR